MDEYQYLVEKFNVKLAGWKAKTLSLAGRATLVQSCIPSIPYYTMQSTKLLRVICWNGDRDQKVRLSVDSELVINMLCKPNLTSSPYLHIIRK